MFNFPNFISVFRVLLAFYAFWFFYTGQDKMVFFALTVIVIALDGLDGIIARKLNQATELGAKLDVYSDRIVELAYWLFFSFIGVLHIWVFLFFLIRGLVVDYLSRKNTKPLGDSFLRSSRFMRAAYGVLKLLSFLLLILFPLELWTQLIVYLTVLVCFLRAIPVLQDSFGS